MARRFTAAAQAGRDGEGAILRAKVALVRPALAMASGRLWTGTDAAGYTRYLAAMYPMSQATVSVLRFARARCLRRPGDPLSRALAVFLTRHIGEESRHERWVAADLAALGNGAPATALPSAGLTGLIGAQYHLIEAVHPVAVLGYMAVLQSDPPSRALLDHLLAVTGDSTAVTALSRHAEPGNAPLAATYALLDRLILGGTLRAAVGLSALHTAVGAIALFAELADTAATAGRPADHPAGSAAAGELSGGGAVELSADELALLGAVNSAAADLADVFAHSADVVGGLFL